MNGMAVVPVINPENLPVNEVLVCWNKAIVLPENAIVIYDEDSSNRSIPHIDINGKEYKYCGVCKKWLRLFEFYKNRTRRDGLQTKCADCDNRLSSFYKKRKRKNRYVYKF
jgi:hypothetical protein